MYFTIRWGGPDAGELIIESGEYVPHDAPELVAAVHSALIGEPGDDQVPGWQRRLGRASRHVLDLRPPENLEARNMHTFRHAMAGVVAFLAALVLYPIVALSDERLELGFEWNDDGSCTESTQSLTLTYLHESDAIDKVYGRIRQAPSGGNCLKESTTRHPRSRKAFPVDSWHPHRVAGPGEVPG